MTKKRFNYHIDEVGIYYYVCDNTKKGDDRIILEFDTKSDAIEVCDLLNSLNNENEQLKQVLGDILLEVRRDITNTNVTGEVKVFINPNSYELISEVLRKFGALKEWYND